MEHTIILNTDHKIDVLLQDEVSMDIDCALTYIKSGEKEIDLYIKNTSKPQLDNVITNAALDMSDQIAQGVEEAKTAAKTAVNQTIGGLVDAAEGDIAAYVETSIIPDLNHKVQEASGFAGSAEQAAISSADAAVAADESKKSADAAAVSASGSAYASAASAAVAANAAADASYGNIGDIKFTLRTDIPKGGAWCDGKIYTKSQYPELYQLLEAGKLQNITAEEYASQLASDGVCGFFGLDSVAQTFRVPLIKDVYLKAGNSNLAEFGVESLPNITGGFAHSTCSGNDNSGAFYAGRGVSTANNGGNYTRDGVYSYFDASLSSSIYQNNAKVNPDHLTYRAYVVLYSAKIETSTVIKDYQIYNTVPLGSPLYTAHQLEDPNYLLSQGQWNEGLVYKALYDLLAAQYNVATDHNMTIGSYTITYRQTPLGYLITTDANNAASIFAESRFPFWVLNIAEQRFKLPQNNLCKQDNSSNSADFDAHKYLYFKVGNASVNLEMINCGNLLNSLTAKADADLSNISPSAEFKKTANSWSIPDYSRATSISTGNFTPETNGIIYVNEISYITDASYWRITDVATGIIIGLKNANGYNQKIITQTYVHKGQTVNLASTHYTFYFAPLTGD